MSAASLDTTAPAARHRELTSLLARAFLRYWRASSDDGDKGLDFAPASKRSCPKPSSEGAGP